MSQLLPAIRVTPWDRAGNHMFDAEWRYMTHHLGRNIIEVARAVEIPNEREGVVQRMTKRARLHDILT
ncbi:MAG TPA: hypothetical protein VGP28_09260 [Methylocella sp.]|jgi:hypothetical protein|nr:hypothetical protein [Methylocella sp.]